MTVEELNGIATALKPNFDTIIAKIESLSNLNTMAMTEIQNCRNSISDLYEKDRKQTEVITAVANTLRKENEVCHAEFGDTLNKLDGRLIGIENHKVFADSAKANSFLLWGIVISGAIGIAGLAVSIFS